MSKGKKNTTNKGTNDVLNNRNSDHTRPKTDTIREPIITDPDETSSNFE